MRTSFLESLALELYEAAERVGLSASPIPWENLHEEEIESWCSLSEVVLSSAVWKAAWLVRTPVVADLPFVSVTHIAGVDVEVQGRFLRQRCSWCGELLLDYDYANTAMPGEWRKPEHFEIGRLVRVHAGNPRRQEALTDDDLPDDACALAEPRRG